MVAFSSGPSSCCVSGENRKQAHRDLKGKLSPTSPVSLLATPRCTNVLNSPKKVGVSFLNLFEWPFTGVIANAQSTTPNSMVPYPLNRFDFSEVIWRNVDSWAFLHNCPILPWADFAIQLWCEYCYLAPASVPDRLPKTTCGSIYGTEDFLWRSLQRYLLGIRKALYHVALAPKADV